MQGFGIDLKPATIAADAVRIRENSYVSRIWTTTADANAVTVEGHGFDVSDGVPLTLIKEGGVYYYVLGTPGGRTARRLYRQRHPRRQRLSGAFNVQRRGGLYQHPLPRVRGKRPGGA